MVPLCSIIIFVELRKKTKKKVTRERFQEYTSNCWVFQRNLHLEKKGGFKMVTNHANHLVRNTDITQTSLTRGGLWWEQEGGVAV